MNKKRPQAIRSYVQYRKLCLWEHQKVDQKTVTWISNGWNSVGKCESQKRSFQNQQQLFTTLLPSRLPVQLFVELQRQRLQFKRSKAWLQRNRTPAIHTQLTWSYAPAMTKCSRSSSTPSRRWPPTLTWSFDYSFMHDDNLRKKKVWERRRNLLVYE